MLIRNALSNMGACLFVLIVLFYVKMAITGVLVAEMNMMIISANRIGKTAVVNLL
jgi:hypothetical protein